MKRSMKKRDRHVIKHETYENCHKLSDPPLFKCFIVKNQKGEGGKCRNGGDMVFFIHISWCLNAKGLSKLF